MTFDSYTHGAGMRQCLRCLTVKPFAAFIAKQGKRRIVYSRFCLDCLAVRAEEDRAARVAAYHKNRDYERNAHKRWRTRNAEHRYAEHRRQLLSRRGVDQSWWERTLAAQNGQCWICGGQDPERTAPNGLPKARLVIDHNHTTGKTRGLLCSRCNHLVGILEVNPERLPRVQEYLQTFG